MSNPNDSKTMQSLVEAANSISEAGMGDRKWSIGLYDFRYETRSPRILWVRKEYDYMHGTEMVRIPPNRSPEDVAKEYAEKYSKGYRLDINGEWLLFQRNNNYPPERLIKLPDWSIEKPK